MHSNGTLPLDVPLDTPLDARCGYALNLASCTYVWNLNDPLILQLVKELTTESAWHMNRLISQSYIDVTSVLEHMKTIAEDILTT